VYDVRTDEHSVQYSMFLERSGKRDGDCFVDYSSFFLDVGTAYFCGLKWINLQFLGNRDCCIFGGSDSDEP